MAKAKTETPFVETEIEAGKDGTGFFDGMKPKVLTIPELNKKVKNVKTNLIPAFQKAQKALSVAKEEIFALANSYKEHFEFDEEKNAYIYDDGVVHLEIEEKELITYDLIDENGGK